MEWLDPKFIAAVAAAVGALYKAIKSIRAEKAHKVLSGELAERMPKEAVEAAVVASATQLEREANKALRRMEKLKIPKLDPEVFKARSPEWFEARRKQQ